MTAFKSLELAIEVATRARDEADEAWVRALRAQRHAQGQMEQLQSYASEIQARWATAAASSFDPELMQHQRNFTVRLQEAITMQGDVLHRQEQQVEAARVQRVQREARLKALQQLLDKRIRERARQEERREQKQVDEWASLAYARKLAGLNH